MSNCRCCPHPKILHPTGFAGNLLALRSSSLVLSVTLFSYRESAPVPLAGGQVLLSAAVLPEGTAIAVGIVFGVSIFAVKWLFDQTVKAWEGKIADLVKRVEGMERVEQQVVLVEGKASILERRLENLGMALQDTQRLVVDSQKDSLKLRQELSSDYVRREDWIRFSSTLEAKMDSLNRKVEARFDSVMERLQK